MTARYHEFMRHHQRIEGWLRVQCGGEQCRLGFADMVRKTAPHNPLLRRHLKRLMELNDLRNLIAHKAGAPGEPIAEPTAGVVSELGLLAERLSSPPKLPTRVLHEVQLFSTAQPLSEALTLMREQAFSQVPVTEEGRVIGVLTAVTVMRWLASHVQDELVDIVATPIGAVLSAQERDDHWEFFSAMADCEEALARFVDSQQSGRALEVLLLTDTGRRQLPLRGIVTVSDLGELASCLMEKA